MSNIPNSPPFSYCAVDFFGPWYVKEGRREVKRYGALFTCMASRAIHIEVAHSMETDSFLQALRRLVSRRGLIRELRSDQGTNFVGAENELKRALQEIDDAKIKAELLKHNIDFIDFKEMFIARGAGRVYIILLMSSGAGGVKNIYRAYKREKKWTRHRRNLIEGDIVLLKDNNTCRNKWPMARVLAARRDEQGQVRSVTVQSATGSVLNRPLNKLVLLLESPEDRPGIPDEEPEDHF